MHKAGKVYSVITKSLDIHQFTDRQIVFKLRQFSNVHLFLEAPSQKTQHRKLTGVKEALKQQLKA